MLYVTIILSLAWRRQARKASLMTGLLEVEVPKVPFQSVSALRPLLIITSPPALSLPAASPQLLNYGRERHPEGREKTGDSGS